PKEPEQEKKPSGEQYEGYTMQSDATIIVDGKYSPDVIHAQQGKKFTIAFERHDDSPCTDEVVFQDFKIRKKLTPHQTTLVELPPMKTGEYKFSCGMNMVHGTLTVHK
ncbi:MAG: cupredoxin domain-containing protein, partial [Bacteroidetes bacterium]